MQFNLASRDRKFQAPPRVARLAKTLLAIGGLTLFVGLFAAPRQTWGNVLVLSQYLLGLALGGLFLIALQYVTGAGWGVALRRLPEALADLLPVGGAGVLAVLLFYPALYSWTDSAAAGHLAAGGFKHLWLSRPFFLLRAIVYLASWLLFARTMVRLSVRQDGDGSIRHTFTSRRLSAALLVVFGATCWLASVDWIMSLEPEWASTVFGVYQFSGIFLSGLAAITVLAVCLERQGALAGIISKEHLHDLGKLLFSFSSFWMYIWFSQYMLIWYVNNPEETTYYIRRSHGGWQALFYLNLSLNWIIPFLALLPRSTKQSPRVLLIVALTILAGRWVDLHLMILPPLAARPLTGLGLLELGLAAGALGACLSIVPRALAKRSLLPFNDPFLVESLPHHPAAAGTAIVFSGIEPRPAG